MTGMEQFLYFIFGLITGFAAILPGIHTNTIAQPLAGVAEPFSASVAIAAATAVGTMLALLPAIFLFVPEQASIVSVLPGHRLVQEGRGLAAIRLCVKTAITALILAPLFLSISYFLIPTTYFVVRPYIAPLLILACAFFVFTEQKRGHAIAILLLSGIFGFVVLNSPLLKEPLFTPFIGLFAISNLLLATKKETRQCIPEQNKSIKLPLPQLFGIVTVGSLLGIFADILPAIGSSAQFATFGAFVAPDAQSFLALTTSITVVHLASAYITLHTIEKARIGSIAMIKSLVGIPEINFVILYLLATAVGIAIGALALLVVARPFLNFVKNIGTKKLNVALLIYLLSIVFIVDGLNGIAVTTVATAIGLLAPLCGVRRTLLMGVLIIPAIIYLLV